MLDDGTRIDVSVFHADFDEEFLAGNGLRELHRWLAENSSRAVRVPDAVRLGPPLARPSKIVCIGLNFRDHAAESNMQIPDEPVIFLKSTTSLVGPNDDVMIPKNGHKLDW